jgi:hypothetical protein
VFPNATFSVQVHPTVTGFLLVTNAFLTIQLSLSFGPYDYAQKKKAKEEVV